MKAKALITLCLIGIGIILQIVFWKTRILFTGILGYAAFALGIARFPGTISFKRPPRNEPKQ